MILLTIVLHLEKEKMSEYFSQEEVEILPLFSTPLIKTNIGRDFTKDEMNYISNIPMTKIGRGERKKGQESLKTTLFEDSPNLKNIKSFCENQVENYMTQIEGADTNIISLCITESWLNKNKPGESHHSHHHSNSYLSGILYINCLPNDNINLENRSYGLFNNIEFPRKNNTIWNSAGAIINVKEGDLILFSSWVPHFVNRNETKDKERISLAFNTFPIGNLELLYTNG